MIQITMDWETYRKEIVDSAIRYEQGFDDGAKANEKRLKPLHDFLRDAVTGKAPGDPIKLREIMEEVGWL